MYAQHQAFDALYREHQTWLLRWLSGRLGCREVAQDLTQDTFIRLWSGREAGQMQEPRAFLTTVAKGVMANWFRRQSLECAYLEVLAALPEPSMPSAEDQALVREALNLIDAMLDALPAQARCVFLMSQFEGLAYAEIAKSLSISLSTVKRHMKLAMLGCLAHAP